MYNIDRTKDKPDIGYMEMQADKLMARGIKIADYKESLDHYVKLREVLREDFSKKYGVDNPNSSKQLVNFITNLSNEVDLGSKNDIIEICYDDKTGKWTSKADAMEKLAALGYQFAKDLLDYREAKSNAQAIESLVEYIDSEQRIHPQVKLTKTNRVSYSEPALMNIPKKLLWQLVDSDKPGNALFSVDIKNQEPSILANLTGAEELKIALESPEGLYESLFKQCFKPCAYANVLIDTFMENRVYDIEEIKSLGTISPMMYMAAKPQTDNIKYNGDKIVGVETICMGGEKGVKPELPNTVRVETEQGDIVELPVKWVEEDIKYKRANDYQVRGYIEGLDIDISPIERAEFKTSYLAISYGASIFTIKEHCKHIDGKRVYQFVTGIEAIKQYKKRANQRAAQGLQTVWTAFGTELVANEFDEYRLKRVLMDLPIQGTGADILSLLIKRVYDYTEQNGLVGKVSLYYTRHDELIIEVDKDWLGQVGKEKVVDILKDMLEHQIIGWTPFKIEIEQVR